MCSAVEALARELPVLVEAMRHSVTIRRGIAARSAARSHWASPPRNSCRRGGAGREIEVRSTRGTGQCRRTILPGPVYDGLEADELLTGLTFPTAYRAYPVFREVAQRPGDFALVGLVGALSIEDGKIARAGLAWFGMGPTPIKPKAAEQMLLGLSPDGLTAGPCRARHRDTAPFDDHHASAEYRRTVGALSLRARCARR